MKWSHKTEHCLISWQWNDDNFCDIDEALNHVITIWLMINYRAIAWHLKQIIDDCQNETRQGNWKYQPGWDWKPIGSRWDHKHDRSGFSGISRNLQSNYLLSNHVTLYEWQSSLKPLLILSIMPNSTSLVFTLNSISHIFMA